MNGEHYCCYDDETLLNNKIIKTNGGGASARLILIMYYERFKPGVHDLIYVMSSGRSPPIPSFTPSIKALQPLTVSSK